MVINVLMTTILKQNNKTWRNEIVIQKFLISAESQKIKLRKIIPYIKALGT